MSLLALTAHIVTASSAPSPLQRTFSTLQNVPNRSYDGFPCPPFLPPRHHGSTPSLHPPQSTNDLCREPAKPNRRRGKSPEEAHAKRAKLMTKGMYQGREEDTRRREVKPARPSALHGLALRSCRQLAVVG
ncbi:hypothetical protein DFP72DRAFT_931712 [Ephemerocybe angulata]|uniref:Uncharacterized protein n=1 Tax=Ephemerocybe angulata TaxID=980116 RepID=A0A8H6LWI7_9AGAR|nr:hypothetical protein DFP72DRAFT_931712 [Tulosesus angulatus]